MKFKRLHTLLFLVLVEILFVSVQSQTVSLTIKNWDGTDKNVELSLLKKMAFSGTNLVLSYLNGGDESITVSTVHKMFFGSYTNVNEISDNNKSVSIYPNPSSGYIYLKHVMENSTHATVYNVNGVAVMTVNLSSGTEKIDVNALSKGIYFVKINSQVFKFTRL
ncbi:MAG: T9SS type A sorting domain-containing protein [Paludibacter sp.]